MCVCVCGWQRLALTVVDTPAELTEATLVVPTGATRSTRGRAGDAGTAPRIEVMPSSSPPP
jgi:hypothetical protein